MIYSFFPAFRSKTITRLVDVRDDCPVPLPNLLSADPPSSTHPLILEAVNTFKFNFETYFDNSDLDSVAITVVTPKESVFEVFRGSLRANESSGDHNPRVDRNSVYRIASVSKLFTALETFLLRERGALNLDDPVSKFIPELRPSRYSLSAQDTKDPITITIRQLLSHMSGIGRDWPPGDATSHWPKSLDGAGPPPYNGMPFPTRESFLAALNVNSWLAEPYTFPVYSNTGYNLLGYVNLLADAKSESRESLLDHATIIKRDIFQPLGFNGSSFLITDEYKQHAVVSSSAPWETDIDFELLNPGGGQASSLSDLVLLAQNLLNPAAEDPLLRPAVLREWLRPLHSEWDGFTAVGMLWEIYKAKYSHGRSIDVYQKLGDLNSHHSGFTLLPSRSAAIVVLLTGKTGSHVYNLTNLAIKHFVPALDAILAAKVEEQLGGRWVSKDSNTVLNLHVQKESLYATEFNINGTDALATLEGSKMKGVPVWHMGNEEYRLSPPWNSNGYGCSVQWMNLDAFAYANHAAVNMFRLIKDPQNAASNVLHIPSMQLDLVRK